MGEGSASGAIHWPKKSLSISITHLSTSGEKDHLFNDKIACNKWVKDFLKALKKQEHSDN